MKSIIQSINTIFLIFLMGFLIYGCAPSILFTSEQFPENKSDTHIPEEWRGEWNDNFNFARFGLRAFDDSLTCYIRKDSMNIAGIEYKIVQSNLNLKESDSQNSFVSRVDSLDKLVFQDDWCFFSIHTKNTSIPSGYRVFVGNIDKNGDIRFWDMNYTYFLKKKLVNKIPVLKYMGWENIDYDDLNTSFSEIMDGNLTDSSTSFMNKLNLSMNLKLDSLRQEYLIQSADMRVLYVDVKELPKKSYRKFLRKAIIYTSFSSYNFTTCIMPYYSSETFDVDFFKKVANKRKPDVILKKDGSVEYRSETLREEGRYSKRSKKNKREKYLNKILLD